MSGSVLEEKENLEVVHEFAKEDVELTTTSILKPSQKDNVGQLTPTKAPKVTFKNTPLRHHPARYDVEQPIELRDTWDLIRCLDEEENWTERTQVVTKEDHQIHLEAAKEFLDYIIDNLPCFNSPKKESKETAFKEPEKKNSEIAAPVPSHTKTMDDLAGPLDPAIASLNSLLKAGEEEEIAFSPIGSGKNSPDCDNMVTSDDIEKLLAPHYMPDDLDIPSLELIHGNKIDALMDSKFSGKHLDEVAAKLNELKLSSTNLNTKNEDDFDQPIKPRGGTGKVVIPKDDNGDFDGLPIKPRGAKTSQQIVVPQDEKSDNLDDLPIKPRGGKAQVVTPKEGYNSEFDNLPIKPRGGKAQVVMPKEDDDNDFDNLPIKPRGNKSQIVMPKEDNSNDLDDLPIKPRGAKKPQETVVPQEENDDDFDNLPIKPRGPKKTPPKEEEQKTEEDIDLPVKPRGGKKSPVNVDSERKENEEIKENGNDDENLPVKKRQPKAVAPKKDGEAGNDEEKENFKKPMPPKPWKTKKKKVQQSEDPFVVMFSEPAKSISTNEKPTQDQAPSEQKPSVIDANNEIAPKETIDGEVPQNREGNIDCQEPAGSGMDGVAFTDTQEDFGFTNDDFQPGNAFSLELDYLEKFGNSTNNLDRQSALARQSLYVKFDPLCKGRSPDQQALQKKLAEANASSQAAGNNGDLLMNTPPSRRTAQSKLSSIKEGGITNKATSDLSDVDKLLTFSPLAKGAQQTKPEKTQPTEAPATAEDDAALVQPLLYSKSDIENAVKKERDVLLKQTHEESQLREMEIQDILSKLQTEAEKNAKLKRENDELKTVMKEYEKTMAEMIESTEKDKNMADESKNEITKERDQLQADLNSVEAAFSDLHRRYEKMKGALENFKKNEEILKKAAQDYQEKLRKSSEKYQMLKKHAEEKIETANIEINRVRRSNDSEMAVMRAALKKEQNKSASLEQAIQQKINENKELTAICDELIQRASSK